MACLHEDGKLVAIDAPRIGTAGWAIPRAVAPSFPVEGTGLARYASRFDAAEINSSFHRPHRRATYARWRDATPDGFRFSVKLPRAITHNARLIDCRAKLDAFVGEVAELGAKLGPLLIQLPPSLAFDAAIAGGFMDALRSLTPGPLACEPRHPSWFDAEADAVMVKHRVSRVAADPVRHALGAVPGGWRGLAYRRLHGSPRVYYSPYEDERLRQLAHELQGEAAAESWCVFDNTASGAALADALRLRAMLEPEPSAPE